MTAPFTGALTPQVVNNGASLAPLAFRGLDPNFTNPVSHSWDIAVEQELPYRSALTLSYVGNRAQHLPYFIDANVAPATTTKSYDVVDSSGNTLSTVTVPWYTQRTTYADQSVLVGFSGVNSWYNSMVATLKKPFSHGLELLVNYTFSNATDGGQVSGVNGTFNGTDVPIDPYNLKAENGTSDLNMRSRATGSIVYAPAVRVDNLLMRNVLNGWSISGSYTAQSGNPLTGLMFNSPSSALGVDDPNNTAHVSGNSGLTGASVSLFNSGTNTRVPQFKRNSFRDPVCTTSTPAFPATLRCTRASSSSSWWKPSIWPTTATSSPPTPSIRPTTRPCPLALRATTPPATPRSTPTAAFSHTPAPHSPLPLPLTRCCSDRARRSSQPSLSSSQPCACCPDLIAEIRAARLN